MSLDGRRVGDLAMSVSQVERQLPVLLQSLQGIGAVAQAALANQPAAERDVDVPPAPEFKGAAPAKDPEGLTAAQLKAAMQLFRELAESAPVLAGAVAERKAAARAQIAAVAKAPAAG